ncbi:MAG TPA: Fe-S cluster assembly protein SufD [Candidatus Cybelea sp.]|nr:Fe-S cluster assembly protein SufD [Candidatus Cybelea sp.]
MPSVEVAGPDLGDKLAGLDTALVPLNARRRALEQYLSTGSGRQKTSRFWRIDLETLAPGNDATFSFEQPRIENPNPRAIALDLPAATRDCSDLLAQAFRTTSASQTKFGALATAFAGAGAFVFVPADAACDEPIVITYSIPKNAAVFPYTCVLLERGARATIIERLEGGDGSFVCGIAEAVLGDHAELTYANHQTLAEDARVISTRVARPGRDARFSWASAELGAELSVGDLEVAIEQPGIDANVTALFFPRGTQHVDIVSTVDHVSGDARSQTLVKSAAVDRGQARYLGNIRIAPHAQGSDASLRDDALLLSKHAHIDSIPALEIAANDVKAYHGATVGALEEEQIFYMETRGIERTAAERMIALGFFEPAIDRFPSESLRELLRTEVRAKFS